MTTQPTSTQAADPQANFCPRNPGVETNLRCGKCGMFICPKCLVQSPVGARCPDCAKPIKNPAFSPSRRDMLLAIGAGLGVAVGLGAMLGVAVEGLAGITYGYEVGVLVGQAAIGYVIGVTVYRVARNKRSRGLQYAGGFIAFVAYTAALFVYPAFGTHILALLGLGVGVYVAMGRLKR
ncbi:MAG: hypothetical protein EXR57_00395 [Dehalococcoidia bacterium]|nr:hypothetical protein [Dehalococcoidia bacterium]MSQ34264.1 hypothetical protein [Dehalococcoidia bacterium]